MTVQGVRDVRSWWKRAPPAMVAALPPAGPPGTIHSSRPKKGPGHLSGGFHGAVQVGGVWIPNKRDPQSRDGRPPIPPEAGPRVTWHTIIRGGRLSNPEAASTPTLEPAAPRMISLRTGRTSPLKMCWGGPRATRDYYPRVPQASVPWKVGSIGSPKARFNPTPPQTSAPTVRWASKPPYGPKVPLQRRL